MGVYLPKRLTDETVYLVDARRACQYVCDLHARWVAPDAHPYPEQCLHIRHVLAGIHKDTDRRGVCEPLGCHEFINRIPLAVKLDVCVSNGGHFLTDSRWRHVLLAPHYVKRVCCTDDFVEGIRTERIALWWYVGCCHFFCLLFVSSVVC